MKHKTWFRLLLRAFGVFLFGFAVQHAFELIGQVTWMTSIGPNGFDNLPYLVIEVVSGVIQFAFAFYLFFGGEWIVNKAIPSNRPYCLECGYELSHSKGERCPECGIALPARVGGERPAGN